MVVLVCGLLGVAGGTALAQTPLAPATPRSPRLELGGYFMMEGSAGAGGDTRFPAVDRLFVRRARLTVGAAPTRSLEVKVQGRFENELGHVGTVRFGVTVAYAEWTPRPGVQVRAGQFRAPFGGEGGTSSTALLTVERSLAADRLGVTRQIGALVSGDVRGGRLGYGVAVFHGTAGEFFSRGTPFVYVLRGTAEPWRGHGDDALRVIVGGYWSTEKAQHYVADFGLDSTPLTPAADNLFTGHRRGGSLAAQYTHGPWRIDAELLRERLAQSWLPGVGNPTVSGRGWYAGPSVFVVGRRLQVVGRYQRFDPDASRAADETKTWLAGVNDYLDRQHARFMLDYLWVTAPARPDTHAQLLARLQVEF